MLTDSHCHLASHKFPRSEVADLVGRAGDAGVTRMVTLATCLDDFEANLSIASAHSEVRVCLGIHPCDVHRAPDDVAERIQPLLADRRVCGVGETGLDYYHPAPDGWTEEAFRARQREFLDQHFALACEARLNVVIHTRDRSGDASLQDAMEIFRRHAGKCRAVFHCFISTIENAQRVIDLGGVVSFGGVATFKNAADVLGVASALADGTFMVETDSPYLSPDPHRGERNEPAHTRLIAAKIAAARGASVAELARTTSALASDFFRWIE